MSGHDQSRCRIPWANRRTVLAGGASLLANPSIAASPGPSLFVPGYNAKEAIFDGMNAARHPTIGRAVPASYDGPVTLLSKIDLQTGKAQHAAYPVQGHFVAISADLKIGVLHAQSRDWCVAFDPESLDMITTSRPFREHRTGGGHAEFVRNSSILLTAERSAYGAYLGAPELHHGRIAVRDPQTLQELSQISSHGIGPHDITLLEDGNTLVVANYGTTQPHICRQQASIGIEPCISFIELDSGKLLDKIVVDDLSQQIRHLAASKQDRVMAIMVRQGTIGELEDALNPLNAGVEADLTARGDCAYLPAPMLSVSMQQRGVPAELIEAGNMALMRQGLTILHDPLHDQFIASYPSTHHILVMDGKTGQITKQFDTRSQGLKYPCGVSLFPGGDTYAVAGSFGNIRVYETGTHRHLVEQDINIILYRHSHITIA